MARIMSKDVLTGKTEEKCLRISDSFDELSWRLRAANVSVS